MTARAVVARSLVATAAMVATLVAAVPAIATTLFTTGAPNHLSARLGDRNTDFFDLAQSFRLPVGGTSVTDLTWWGLCASLQGEPPVTSCSGADRFNVAILSDDNGLPGATVATLLAGDGANRSPTGSLVNDVFTEYVYSIAFAPVDLVAGVRYWLEISNAAAAGHWFWEETVGQSTLPSAFRSTTGGAWSSLSDPSTPAVTFAMTVSGNQQGGGGQVPEPAALALLAAALVALAGVRAPRAREPRA